MMRVMECEKEPLIQGSEEPRVPVKDLASIPSA